MYQRLLNSYIPSHLSCVSQTAKWKLHVTLTKLNSNGITFNSSTISDIRSVVSCMRCVYIINSETTSIGIRNYVV